MNNPWCRKGGIAVPGRVTVSECRLLLSEWTDCAAPEQAMLPMGSGCHTQSSPGTEVTLPGWDWHCPCWCWPHIFSSGLGHATVPLSLQSCLMADRTISPSLFALYDVSKSWSEYQNNTFFFPAATKEVIAVSQRIHYSLYWLIFATG